VGDWEGYLDPTARFRGAPGTLHIRQGYEGNLTAWLVRAPLDTIRVPRCGSVRGWQVVSSHLSPGFAPHATPDTAVRVPAAQPRLPFCFPLTAANAGGASPNCCSQISILAGLNHSVLPSFVNGIRK
jgi:hypothetical protein